MLEQRRDSETTTQELKALFRKLDVDGDAALSLDEFVNRFNDVKIRSYVTSLGLSIQDAEMFFRLLTDISGENEITVEDFVEHCAHMKGFATAIDLHQLTFEVKLLRRGLLESGVLQEKKRS